jgi:hypothetical protein
MSGTDIITLLDRVAYEYCQKYIDGDNLDEVIENWGFLNPISNEYKNRQKLNDEEMQSGSKDDAFVYFKDSEELVRYFDAPYQDEYSDYRQLLFVKESLRNKPENPLNALRHSGNDLTGKVDLDNPYYKLREYHEPGKNGVSIEIHANGRMRNNKDKLYKKDKISIKYSKNKYYKDIYEEGKLTDAKITQYLIIDESSGKIDVRKDVDLRPVTQTISFEIKDTKGTPIIDTEIQFGTQQWQKVSRREFQHTFIGEELKEHWTVSARKGNNLILQQISFIPEQLQNGIVPLVLIEYIKVTFQVVNDDEGLVYDYYIQIRDERGELKEYKDFLNFYGDMIYKSWEITIAHNKHKSESFTYCPAKDDNPKFIKLQKKQFGSGNQWGNNRKGEGYYLKIDEKFGKRSWKGKPINKYVTEYPDFKCDSKFGYKFEKWESHKEQSYNNEGEDYHGYYEAIFKELWYHKIPKRYWIIGSIVVGLIIALCCLIFSGKGNENKKEEQQSISLDQISDYVEGDSLFLETLENYKKKWNKQNPNVSETSGGILDIFTGKKKQTNPTNSNDRDKVLQSIDSAITKRELIIAYNFTELKKQQYYPQQQKFITAVEKIDNAKYEEVRKQLDNVNVSTLTLTQIAEKIESVIATITTNPDQEIIDYLDGVELNKEILTQYKEITNDNNLKLRIDTYIKMRTHLNKGEVTQLKALNFPYSEAQKALKTAIDGINNGNKPYIGDAMNKASISLMDLNEIAKFINQKISEHNAKSSSIQQPTTQPAANKTEQTVQQQVSTDVTSEIIEYLKGNELKKKELDNYTTQKISDNLKKSIDLALKFWQLDGQVKEQTYCEFSRKVDKDTNFDGSKLKTFVTKMCNQDIRKYSAQDKIKGLKE